MSYQRPENVFNLVVLKIIYIQKKWATHCYFAVVRGRRKPNQPNSNSDSPRCILMPGKVRQKEDPFGTRRDRNYPALTPQLMSLAGNWEVPTFRTTLRQSVSDAFQYVCIKITSTALR